MSLNTSLRRLEPGLEVLDRVAWIPSQLLASSTPSLLVGSLMPQGISVRDYGVFISCRRPVRFLEP